ncbi:12240_t:CDS:2 [Entrophospora sp. SA101]|nr:12240_t:CDS:2 [Entrophospora sp. SA101]
MSLRGIWDKTPERTFRFVSSKANTMHSKNPMMGFIPNGVIGC